MSTFTSKNTIKEKVQQKKARFQNLHTVKKFIKVLMEFVSDKKMIHYKHMKHNIQGSEGAHFGVIKQKSMAQQGSCWSVKELMDLRWRHELTGTMRDWVGGRGLPLWLP